MGQGVRRDRAGAVAAVAALIEDAELPAVTGAKIEGMLDDRTEARGLDRNRIVALIAQQRAIALIGMVVLVIREPLSGPQIALVDATGIAVDRAHAGQRRAAPIETDVLDQEIADRRGRRHDVLRPSPRGA